MLKKSIFICLFLSHHFSMEGKKKSFSFQTKTIFFPPLNKKVNIILQRHDGPCMLIAIFNSLALKGQISIESGSYTTSQIINEIQTYYPDAYELKKVVNGYYVNPSFDSCNGFEDYPDFLEKLNIKMVHAMAPSKKHKNFNIIKKYNYDSMLFKIIELESSKHHSDELKALQAWNLKVNKQITESGLEQIESQIQEGEVQIFFRKSHFACIYKYLNQVYSLITCRGLGGKNCIWHSLPSPSGDLQYFDQNFNLTLCNPWNEKPSQGNTKKKTSSDLPKSKIENQHKKRAKNNECTIF